MTMIFLRNKHVVGRFLLVLAIIFLVTRPAQSFIRNRVMDLSGFIFIERIAAAQSQYALALLNRIKDLTRQNKELRAAIGSGAKYRIVPADVKFGGGYFFTDMLALAEGENSGIDVGDLATAPGSILIGRVVETGDNWSVVKSIFSVGEKTVLKGRPALPSGRLVFEAIGIGDALVAELPMAADINIGDILRFGIDPDLIAGLVSNVSAAASQNMKRVIINSPLPLKTIGKVEILTKP